MMEVNLQTHAAMILIKKIMKMLRNSRSHIIVQRKPSTSKFGDFEFFR